MKRLVLSHNSTSEYLLKIILYASELDPSGYDVAASTKYINPDPNIKQKSKYSNEQVDELDAVVGKVLRIIKRCGFKVLKSIQSSQSYTYYIRFMPTDEDGNLWKYPVTIQFELRDHPRKDGKGTGWASDQLFIKLFKIGDKTCFSTDGVVDEAKKICLELKKGDYSSLEPVPDYMTYE